MPTHSENGRYIQTKQEILCCCLVSHLAHPRWNITVIKNTLRPPPFAKWNVYHKFMFRNCILEFWLWKLLAWSCRNVRAGNHLSFCQPQMGASQAAPRKNIPRQYQSYVSAGTDSLGHSNIQLGYFQSGWIPCAATRGNQKTEKESGSSVHLGYQHTLFLPLYQLFFQTVETCRHCIMGYLREHGNTL